MILFHSLILIMMLCSISICSIGQSDGRACTKAIEITKSGEVVRGKVMIHQKSWGEKKVNTHNSCWRQPERYPFWYKFTAEQDGSFEFELTPDVKEDSDWDFLLVDITEGCDKDWTVVSCNTSPECGSTGISTVQKNNWQPCNNSGVSPWENTVALKKGRTYALLIDHRAYIDGGFALKLMLP